MTTDVKLINSVLVTQQEETMKRSEIPALTPEGAAAAHRMTAHVLEKEAKQMSSDATKHANEAAAEGSRSLSTSHSETLITYSGTSTDKSKRCSAKYRPERYIVAGWNLEI